MGSSGRSSCCNSPTNRVGTCSEFLSSCSEWSHVCHASGISVLMDNSRDTDNNRDPTDREWRDMLRWGLKKLSRRAVAGASWVAGLSRSEQPISVRVLTYHHFGNSKYDPFSIPPAQFDAQMAFLAKGKLALSLTGLKGFLDGTIAVPHNSVLVTIDDGYLSTWSIALPILKTHGIPAVAFVTPDLVGRRISTDQHITRTYAGWAELSELSVSGIEVASHSLSHRSLGSM